jgi:hypothetical protein
MSRMVLLGSQRQQRTIGGTVADLGLVGRIATITAGWQEWESDDALLREQLGGRALNLRLYARAETVWAADPELRSGHRALHDTLRQLRRLYNRRLAHLADDWIELLSERGSAKLLEPERAQALATIQALDRHHLDRIAELRAQFDEEFRPHERTAVVHEREGILRDLDECDAVVVEGGHVAVLSNRLLLFGLREALADRTILGCSGGAMVLGERIVLFHDSPPSGPGHTEVALPGLGLHRGLVPFPHARTRLRLDAPDRVSRLAERFAPARCVVLRPGTRLDFAEGVWTPVDVERMEDGGQVRRWETAA